MSDPFHHKHPYLTVIMLLIILLVVSEFFSSMFWPRHNYDHHYGHRYGGDYGHHHRYHGGGPYDRDEGPRWRNLRRHPFAEGKPYHMRGSAVMGCSAGLKAACIWGVVLMVA